ncbi:uroporphyrinogen-III synthase [Pseudopelagicola sp. nBUS_19]|uniref:uroporphyrinogen-III synthase n=1 Tax=Pseudopelagicola sp. nBUS_19 TaxID=3395316 RepID=UPI003EBBAE4C
MNTFAPTILLTRPEAASYEFADMLRKSGVGLPILISPVIDIEFMYPPSLDGFQGVLFTSQNGVAAVPGHALPAWCVGDVTAKAASSKGWCSKTAAGDAEALYRQVLSDSPKGRLMHLRGFHARGKLAERLTCAGIPTTETVVYRQNSKSLSAEARVLLGEKYPVIIPLFSPRSAEHLMLQGPIAAPVTIIAMSKAVAQEVASLKCEKLVLVKKPNAESMLSAIIRHLHTY